MDKKSAIVTGASKGIGRGIALELAKQNYNVVVADIDQAGAAAVVAEIQSQGGQALAVACDVSKKSQIDALITTAQEKFGGVHTLVNNAGIYPFKAFADLTEEDWEKVIHTNLRSVFLCSQAAARIMPENSRIISVTSIASMIGFAGLTHYCASKGGINGFTRALALELAPKKITVNAVAPGAILTPGAASSEDVQKQTVAKIPLGRMGTPEDIAHAVAFLASDNANYITGQVLVVDGGWTIQ